MGQLEHLKELAKLDNKTFWRSLDELADEPGIKDAICHEFPQAAEIWDRKFTRRTFLKLMGSAIMMLSMPGCVRRPIEKIIPYVNTPEYLVPGKPLYYASAVSYAGFARGILVENHMGRPTKIEGNPEHPDSLGATDAITQAYIYQLYDPDRSRSVLHQGMMTTWNHAKHELQERLKRQKNTGGEGLRILSHPIISPSLASLRKQFERRFPKARWHQYSPLNQDLSLKAYRQVFGKDLRPVYHVNECDRILSIGSEFLTQGPGAVRYARHFSERRSPAHPRGMNRLYAIESTPTLTGSMSDHRLVLDQFRLERATKHLWQYLQGQKPASLNGLSSNHIRMLNAIAKDLVQNAPRSLIVAGTEQSVAVQSMVALMNHRLKSPGTTLDYIRPIEEFPEDQTQSIQNLVRDLQNGRVSDLIILNGNPMYSLPFDLNFADAVKQAEFRFHFGLFVDETAKVCHFHVPAAHELETWGDARAFNGVVSMQQPMIRPLYHGKAEHQIFAVLAGYDYSSSLDIIQDHWRMAYPRADFETFWNTSVHDGVMQGTAFEPIRVEPRPDFKPLPEDDRLNPDAVTYLFRPDPHILDGRLANNHWLQELPKPLTKLTWDNAALISPKDAFKWKLTNGDVIRIKSRATNVEAPVWILPGQAPNTVTIHLGYGRAFGVTDYARSGFNAYRLQHSNQPFQYQHLSFEKTNRSVKLACTQNHAMMEGRDLVIAAPLAEFLQHPEFVSHTKHEPERGTTLYKPELHLNAQNQWGMSIDLNQCIGCGACTMACQAENNIPVVGKEQVLNNREMHWIRVDRYYKGPPENPETYHQPVPCMHCENAPCEVVCPVEATSHSAEGLNEMTYNRCIGTRYCSNNCPYKVRRFNFYQYTTPADVRQEDNLLYFGRNPDVTVRQRGVMEKCTYCVQRINVSRIEAKKEGRNIRDGEIVPACQQACPSQAILFGDINDPHSRVAKEKDNPRSYGLLTELGTRPRTTYLAKLKNLNPAIKI